MKKLIIIFIAIISLYSCGNKYALKNLTAIENHTRSSVFNLLQDSMLCYLNDYFPTITKVDSITPPKGITIDELEENNSFIIKKDSTCKGVHVVNIWKNGINYALVVQIFNNKQREQMFTLTPKSKKELKIGFNNKPENIIVVWQNIELPSHFIRVKGSTATIVVPDNIKNNMALRSLKRSYLRVFASNNDVLYSDILVPLENGELLLTPNFINRKDHESKIMYSLMIDRFNNGNSNNDWKINSPKVLPQVDYYGGDIKGITDKVNDNYFADLGINTIWISPITQNPYDSWGLNEDPVTEFSGYHGYWPIYSTKIDDRFGNKDELNELLNTSHKNNLNVILDYVANHLHIESPLVKENPTWITNLYLKDGRENIALWDEERLTTWFDKHLATLDLENPNVRDIMTDSTVYWLQNYDFDGFRHDACKHIPLEYWRDLVSKMNLINPTQNYFQIGETYGSNELIGSYVKSGLLNGQFDFNVYFTAINSLGNEKGDMNNLLNEILNSLNSYGYHNQMGYISGNHDQPRFISLAGGELKWDEDHKKAGWNREISVGDSIAYNKLLMLHTINFTIPGIPCIYQGDEYGEPGGNDPDNRRMMRFAGLSKSEEELLDNVRCLVNLRSSSLALIFGQFIPLESDINSIAYARTFMGETIVIGINNSDTIKEYSLKLPLLLADNEVKMNIEPYNTKIIKLNKR